MIYFPISNGKEANARFTHYREMFTYLNKDGVKTSQARPVATECTILIDGEVVGKGVTRCSPEDQFEYSYGRKLSLERALKDAKVPQEMRNGAWKKYFEQSKPKKNI